MTDSWTVSPTEAKAIRLWVRKNGFVTTRGNGRGSDWTRSDGPEMTVWLSRPYPDFRETEEYRVWVTFGN